MRKPTRILLALGALCASLLVSAGAAHAQGADDDALMLVAKPGIGPQFSETVLVAIPAEDSGYVGFIINRPLARTLGSLFPERRVARKVVDPVRFGGPEMSDTIFAVTHARPENRDETEPLFGDVVVAMRAEAIDRIVERTPNEARYFLGCVSWGPGELEAEIADGLWFVMEPKGDLMWRKDTRGLWQELVRRLGIEPRIPGGSAV